MSSRRFLTVSCFVWMSGCATTIVPPKEPPVPASVFVIDFGRHTALLLPGGPDGSLIEYAYGEWMWFALDKSKSYRVFPTLFWPTRGTLGRRALSVSPDLYAIRRAVPCADVLEVVVASEDAMSLSARLDAQFERHVNSMHFQPLYDLDFVHSDKAFHLFHNCNGAVAGWLRELGCEVRGAVVFANFVVK